MDLVTEVERIPVLGETILGNSFTTTPGGKGANQAIACARLGADVYFFAAVGDDAYGQQHLSNLGKNNVHTTYIETIKGVSSGVASITIEGGDNSIIVVPGANSYVTADMIERNKEVFKDFDVILASLEVPLAPIQTAINIAADYDIPFVLNPAPATELPKDMLEKVTVITPNEYELPMIMGLLPNLKEHDQYMKEYPGPIVMTKGSHGAFVKTISSEDIKHIPSYQVDVIDTTGAGDAFNAGLTYMLSLGKSMEEATKFAVAVGALTVTKLGAQSGLPTMEECIDFMKDNS